VPHFPPAPATNHPQSYRTSSEEWSDVWNRRREVLGPRGGTLGFLGSIGVRFMVDGSESGGGFSLVEHPMSPRAVGAPLHRHSREVNDTASRSTRRAFPNCWRASICGWAIRSSVATEFDARQFP
jgi:hypothetical protein